MSVIEGYNKDTRKNLLWSRRKLHQIDYSPNKEKHLSILRATAIGLQLCGEGFLQKDDCKHIRSLQEQGDQIDAYSP